MRILLFSSLFRLLSGAGLAEIPAVPGGPGILVNPCVFVATISLSHPTLMLSLAFEAPPFRDFSGAISALAPNWGGVLCSVGFHSRSSGCFARYGSLA